MAPPIDMPQPQPAQLTITAGTNFGSVTVNETSTEMSFTVGNSGEVATGTVSANIIGSGASQFTIESNNCGTVAPGATCVIAVTFTPTTPGAKSASLQVTADPGSAATASLDGTGRSTGQLSISPTGSQNLGSSVIGTASATTATFTVTNDGGVPTTAVSVTAGGSNPGDFAKSNDTCTGVLQPAGTCEFTVTFTATAAGTRSALFDVAATVGGSVNAAVTGVGLLPAQLEVTPALQPFGSIVVGQSSGDIAFTVRNIGQVATSTVSHSISGDSADFPLVSSDCNSTLAPNATCTIIRHFTPTTTGMRNATITATAATGGSDTANLVGDGISVGTIQITPSPHVFTPAQTVGTASTAQIFTVTNTGASTAGTLTTALGGADAAQFTIPPASNACNGATLNGGQSCTIAVQFTPTTSGNKSAVLSVTGINVATAGISGTAIDAAELEITPATQDFGSIGTGTSTNFVTFTVRNVGGQPTAAAPQVVLGGANATQFNMQNNLCNTALTAAGTPGDSCTVQARFAPTINGDFNATITASAAGTTDVSTLHGEGVNPAQLQPGGTPPTTFLNFPLTLIGDTSAQQVFTIVNNGTETTGAITIAKSGTNAAEFNVANSCSAPLAAGFSCTVTVTFQPTDRGLRTASIDVSASPGGSFSVALSGNADSRLRVTGTALTGDLTLSGASHDFDSVIINTSNPPTATITLVNNIAGPGTSTITTTSTGISPNYSISGNTCTGTIANGGGTCQMVVTFLPTSVGVKNASITVGVNGAGANNTQVITLTGEGVNSLQIAPVTGTPPSGNFGNVAVGTASAPRTFRVTNPANSPTSGNISTVLTGAAYQIVSNTCASVAGFNNTLDGGESCDIVVIFLPTANQTFAGSIAVSATPGGSVTQALTGVGTGQADITITTPTNFGLVFAGSQSAPQTITIENTGGVPTTIGAVNVFAGANPTQFARVGGSCAAGGQTLNAGQSCTVDVRFTPGNLTAPLARSATLTVTATPSATGPKTVTFNGTARSTIVVDNNGAFGPVTIGTSPAPTRVLTVTNESPTSVNVTSSNPGGPFNIVANTCGAGLPAVTAAPANTCTITVNYNPSGTAVQTANLVVTATNGSATAALSGTPVSVTTLVLLEQNSCGFGPPMTCTNRDFGSAFVNTLGSTETFTFRNNGGQTSGPLSVMKLGTNPADFTILSMGCQGQTLALGETCTVVVQFTPALTSTGQRNATLRVVPSSGPGTMVDAALTGRGIATGGVTVTPASANFEATTEDLNVPSNINDFVVQNTGSGTENLNLKFCNFNDGTCPSTQFSIVGAGTTCGATLASGQSCNVRVQFTPNDPQFVDFTITRYLIVQGGACTTAGSCAGQPYAALRGRVLSKPNVTISSTSFNFGDKAVTTDTPLTLTLTNSGQTASGVVSTGTLQAPNANQFAITADTCNGNTIAPNGGTCTLTLNFRPTQTGLQQSSFSLAMGTLSDGDPGGFATTPVTINLMGTGLNQASISITPSAPPTNAGSAPVGSVTGAPMVFTLSNIAGSASTSAVSFSLTNEADYDIVGGTCVNGVTTLAASSNCTIQVAFRPSNAGTRTTRLNVNANVGGSAFSDITGNGTNPLTAAPSPAALGLGSAEVTITFTNSVGAGGASIGLLGSTLGGTSASQVSIVSDDCAGMTLMAGDTCDVVVRRIPGGTFSSATLTVAGAISGTGSTATTPVTLN